MGAVRSVIRNERTANNVHALRAHTSACIVTATKANRLEPLAPAFDGDDNGYSGEADDDDWMMAMTTATVGEGSAMETPVIIPATTTHMTTSTMTGRGGGDGEYNGDGLMTL